MAGTKMGDRSGTMEDLHPAAAVNAQAMTGPEFAHIRELARYISLRRLPAPKRRMKGTSA